MAITNKLVLSVPETGELLSISRAQAYLMVKEGRLPVIRLGRRIVVPKAALMRVLENTTPASKNKE